MFLSIFKMMLNAERCSVLPSSTVPSLIDVVEHLRHIALDPHTLDNQIKDIWVGVEPPGCNPQDDVRHLPAKVPRLHHVDEEPRVAGAGREMLVPGRVPPALQPQPPDLPEDSYTIILKQAHLP
jgi:hypothetical protein